VPSELSSLGRAIFKVCKATGICSVIEQPDGSVKMSNMTIICYVLHVCGPMREDMLTLRLLAFQVVCTVFAFVVRYVADTHTPCKLCVARPRSSSCPACLLIDGAVLHVRAHRYKFAAVLYGSENVE
jgi:hypothetical protein